MKQGIGFEQLYDFMNNKVKRRIQKYCMNNVEL